MLLPPLLQVLATLAVAVAQLTFLYHSSPPQLTISVFAHVRSVLQRKPTGPMRASRPEPCFRQAVHLCSTSDAEVEHVDLLNDVQCPTCAFGLR